ncbi:MAG: SDR family oxidoreductase, partial [Actinomycetota bacterium]|nr:SDR family oxidoreductase [Actinomycetota bacterium]
DLRGTGITANAISPGSTDTAGLAESARLYGLPSPLDFAIQQPIERLIQPAEIAAAVLWLADAGTGAVTGTTIAVDGGLAL